MKDNSLRMFKDPNISLTVIKASSTKILTKEYGELIDFESGSSGGLVLFPPYKLIQFLTEEIRNAGAPDFIALGKGLGNGYPISSLFVRSLLAKVIESSAFTYVQSHTDDPLGCIVAKKVVEIMLNENLVKQGRSMGEYLCIKLTDLGRRSGSILEVRGRGMMNIIFLKETHEAKDIFKALLEKGFFTSYSDVHNTIRLYGPLTISCEEADKLCHALELIL